MLTDTHKELIMYIRKKMFIHNNSPIYLDNREKGTTTSGMFWEITGKMFDARLWVAPANNFAYIRDNFCFVINNIDNKRFNFIFIDEDFQYRLCGRINILDNVPGVGRPLSAFLPTKLYKNEILLGGKRCYAYTERHGAKIAAYGEGILTYFGLTYIDHEYADIEDQVEIHQTPSDTKPPVKVRYIRKVLRRYPNGPKGTRARLTTGYEVPPKRRFYKHPRYVNVRGTWGEVAGYHVGPPTDDRPIEYRREVV